MGLKRIVEPASLAVDLTLAKKQVEIAESDSTHDAQITKEIKRATDFVERWTRRALITQQWRLTLDCLDERIALPRPPAISVESVQYRDSNNTWQTHSSSDYTLLDESSPAELYFTNLPSSNSILPQSYRINYTAGYGSSYTSIPAEYTGVIYELVAFWFLNRGDEVGTFNTNKIPNQIKMALDVLKCGARLGYYEILEDD